MGVVWACSARAWLVGMQLIGHAAFSPPQGFFLLGIEEIGVQVEEPLGVVALEHWCEVVEERIHQISSEHAAVQAVQALVVSGASSTAVAAAAAATVGAGVAAGTGAAAVVGGGPQLPAPEVNAHPLPVSSEAMLLKK